MIINSVTCQPMPRPRTEGGIIVALAYLDTAMKVPVDWKSSTMPIRRLIITHLFFIILGKAAQTNLYKSDKWGHHHRKTFSSIKCWSSPLERVWNINPTMFFQHIWNELLPKTRVSGKGGAIVIDCLNAYQGAPLISPERSTRQCICVFVRAFLYAPLAVRMYAYSHTIAMVKITENRSNTGFATWIAWGKYCTCVEQMH